MEELNENETVKALQEAHRNDDRAEIERLEEKYAAEVRARLDTTKDQFDKIVVEVKEAETSEKKRTGKTQRYKELIALYREAFALAKEISEFKKKMRKKL